MQGLATFNDEDVYGGDYGACEDIWTQDCEDAFLEAYELYPSSGRTKIKSCDGRNELISKYIYQKTGKLRTRKQVSSHIQVLVKKHNKYASSDEKSPKPKSLRHAQAIMESEQKQRVRDYCSMKKDWPSPAISEEELQIPVSYKDSEFNRSKANAMFTPLLSPALSTRSRGDISMDDSINFSSKSLKALASPMMSPKIGSPSLSHDPLDLLVSAAVFMKRQKSLYEIDTMIQKLLKFERFGLDYDPITLKPKLICWAFAEKDVEITTQLYVYGEKNIELRQVHSFDNAFVSFQIHLGPMEQWIGNILKRIQELSDLDSANNFLRSIHLRFVVRALDNGGMENSVLYYGIHVKELCIGQIPYLELKSLNWHDNCQ